MKELIALIVFLGVSGLAIWMAVRGRASSSLTAILLTFALVAGWGIANVDWVRQVQWEVPGLDAFRKQVAAIKAEAIAEVEKASEEHRKDFRLTVTGAEEAGDKSDLRRRSLEAVLEAALKTEERLKLQEERLKELANQESAAKGEVLEVSQANTELALLIARIAWLLLETRNEAGDDRCRAAAQGVMEGLDEVAAKLIKDPEQRDRFISDVMNSIPPRQ